MALDVITFVITSHRKTRHLFARAGKPNINALHLGADCVQPGTAGTVEPRYFLNRSSLLNTSSRTAGADLGSGHKIEPA